MKISILTPDLSDNCLGRAYILAKTLQRYYQTEIVGPIFGNEIWKPVAEDKGVSYKGVKMKGIFKPYCRFGELLEKIDGDVIYAHKPLFTSFGIGLIKKRRSKKTLILDIDDWQIGFMKETYGNPSLVGRLKSLTYSTLRPYSIRSYWNSLVSEKLIHFADEITVSNSFLKERFGGIVVPHGRDTGAFNPEKYDKNLTRRKYKIKEAKKVVMFFGTPRLHKGIEDLIKAMGLIKDRNIILVVVGISKDKYCQNLVRDIERTLNERFRVFGLQPFEKVPDFLAIADVVVVPQRKNFATMGQVPAKVFDAMAMAKPIIATNVNELPEILEGCGRIVEPENPRQLANAIQYVLKSPHQTKEMAWNARQKCIEKYSWDTMEKVLVDIFKKYE